MDNFNKNLIVVNEDDEIIGTDLAVNAHLKSSLALHRAFSVLIFDKNNNFLLTKRSSNKLVYPDFWVNACCSHPFISIKSFDDPIIDVKEHAIKRLNYELGISGVTIEELQFKGRIIYKATDDENWGMIINSEVKRQGYKDFNLSSKNVLMDLKSSDFGEYEVDYILALKKDVSLNLRSSEVSEFKYLNEKEFNDFIKSDEKIGQWLLVINEQFDIFKFYN